MGKSMSRKDFVLALLVVTVWGSSFTVIRIGLNDVPPLLLAAMRFALAALPAVFFVRRPQIRLRFLLAYGATVGIGQFGCMFYAMHIGLPAGLASVVLQSQAFFTLLLAALLLNERIVPRQLAGLVMAALGLVLIGSATGLAGTRIIQAILRNDQSVLPVSSMLHDWHGISDVSMSVPTVLGRGGVVKELELPVSERELAQLRTSADHIRSMVRSLGF